MTVYKDFTESISGTYVFSTSLQTFEIA